MDRVVERFQIPGVARRLHAFRNVRQFFGEPDTELGRFGGFLFAVLRRPPLQVLLQIRDVRQNLAGLRLLFAHRARQ